MIRLKPGVSLDRTHHRVFLMVSVAAPIWAKYDSPDLWIVGGNEPGHATNPDRRRQFHHLPDGTCQAVDLRTWTIPTVDRRREAAKELGAILGATYDVLYERPGERGEHVHAQYDPDRPGPR
jgi:hypothetical protein